MTDEPTATVIDLFKPTDPETRRRLWVHLKSRHQRHRRIRALMVFDRKFTFNKRGQVVSEDV